MLLSLRHDRRALLVLLIRVQFARLGLLRGVLPEQPLRDENHLWHRSWWCGARLPFLLRHHALLRQPHYRQRPSWLGEHSHLHCRTY